MGNKRLMRRLEFEVEIRRAEPATLRQIGASERHLKRMQRDWPARVIGVPAVTEIRSSGVTYPAVRLSMLPYALVMSVMSVGLIVLIRLFVTGGLPLTLFMLGGFGVIVLGLAGCAYIALRSWRAMQGLRQWQEQLIQPRRWSWE